MIRLLTAGRKPDILPAVPPSEQKPASTLLRSALRYFSQEELATTLGVEARTIRRWMVGESVPKSGYLRAIELELARDERPRQPDFTFIDLFAGIGGLRRGFEAQNGRCLFTSEWDAPACKTYKANFPDSDDIWGDITELRTPEKIGSTIPDHDLLLAGFPCQPFSLAGVSKKNSLGRAHGFLDKTQGTLFFNIVRILDTKKPKGFLLENVKNLRSHDAGRTYTVIMGALRELGYHVYDCVIDASAWVPQRRERVFLVGFRDPVSFDFKSLARPRTEPTLGDILHRADEVPEEPYTTVRKGRTVVSDRYTLSDHLWQYLQDYAAKHRAKGNGFGCSVFGKGGVARTLSARYHKDGSEILIEQKGKNPRRLTPRECARLMGFDSASSKPVAIPVSDTQAYRQFGNSVVVPIVDALAREMVPRLLRPADFKLTRKEVEQQDLAFADSAA
jgi:DNA (cytosine-5)-methyltransferase 1